MLAVSNMTGLRWLFLIPLLCGCSKSDMPAHWGKPVPELDSRLQAFFAAKEAQAHELTQQHGKLVPAELWPYFKAGSKSDWKKVSRLYFEISNRSNQFDGSEEDELMLTPAWQTVNETFRVYEQLSAAEPKYLLEYGHDIVESIPAGSVYFGGTDAGRFVVTFLVKDHPRGNPFFVLTQNALTDSLYLDYLRQMYATNLVTLTAEDSQNGFNGYLEEANKRYEGGKLLPGENYTIVDGRPSISGEVAVMAINAKLVRTLFDNNPDREFFIEQSFRQVIGWCHPHLSPHGFVFKINRTPWKSLPSDLVSQDREFWNRWTAKLIGPWLDEKTSVQEITNFVIKVYLHKDLAGFTGDPDYIHTARMWTQLPDHLGAAVTFSKSRSAIGELYAWRSRVAQTAGEQMAMKRQADYALRQALALCPYQIDTVTHYLNLLIEENRFDEATGVLKLVGLFHPKEQDYQNWVAERMSIIEAYRKKIDQPK
jgi:hypothetical protein